MVETIKSIEHDTGRHGVIRLQRPRHYSRAIQVQRLAADADEPVLACAAALGLAWQAGTSDRKPRADWVKLKGGWRYGEAIVDELIGRGWSILEVVTAGNEALPIVVGMIADMLGEDEVKEAEAFSKAGEGSP